LLPVLRRRPHHSRVLLLLAVVVFNQSIAVGREALVGLLQDPVLRLF
jgi:hypothetical protein